MNGNNNARRAINQIRLRKAFEWLNWRYSVSSNINDFLDPIIKLAGLCGHKRWSRFMKYFAEINFVACSCCLLWRGIVYGYLFGLLTLGLLCLILT